MDTRFLRFALIGGVAFVVDAALYCLTSGVLNQPLLQKLIGFAGGVSTTYLLNSAFTFRARLSLTRYGLYLLSQAGGMAVNLVAFLIALAFVPALLALAMATLAGLVVNFLGARRVLSRSTRLG